MRTTRLHIVALMVTACYAVPAAAQSLADIAKKEEERRKDIKTPSKILTNKDLSPAPPGSSVPSPAASPGPAPADAAPASPSDSGEGKDGKEKPAAKDQKYWAGKMKTLQEALSRDQVLLDAMQTRVASLTTDFVNRDDPAQRAVIERNRVTALGELNRLKGQIQQDQKAIDDLQEEARRAGVPPGWLR
jgi:hypothetical protein